MFEFEVKNDEVWQENCVIKTSTIAIEFQAMNFVQQKGSIFLKKDRFVSRVSRNEFCSTKRMDPFEKG